MSAKHTPGPWEVQLSDKLHVFGTDDRSKHICIAYPEANPDADGWVPESIPEAAANARLIASAPDLLSIAKRWAALDGGAWHVDRHAREKADLLADTKVAIAKAEGRS